MKTLPEDIILTSGSHRSMEQGACVMELVSYLADEPWSDMPQCTCPVLSKLAQGLNDGAPDDETRTEVLKPYLQRLIGTRADKATEMRRMWAVVDIAVRVIAAEAMEVAGLPEQAAKLKALEKVDNEDAAWAAGDAAWAAGDAARDAAGDAARAAGDAARAARAAGDAAWAAGDAARDAAGDAARAAGDAARDAARAAARKKKTWTRYTQMLLDAALEA